MNSGAKWMKLSARSRRNRSTLSDFGTKISRRQATKRCAICSRRPELDVRRQHVSVEHSIEQGEIVSDVTTEVMIGAFAHPLMGAREDYDPLLEMIGGARFVLL